MSSIHNMRILIAPNAFKNALSATEAALAIERGLQASRFGGTTECFPIGDGGDGTGELIIGHRQGKVVRVAVHDPLGRPVEAEFGLIDEEADTGVMEDAGPAVIEMASASGLRLLDKKELDPLRASSFGTGELIRQALDRGARRIILGVGGSATVDGGCGILQALGVRFLDRSGKEMGAGRINEPGLPERLTELDRIDLSGLDKRISPGTITVLCDVDNILLGDQGAAAVFGPQKGASPEDVRQIEAGLKRLTEVAGVDMATVPCGGAAGGVAAGLYAMAGARLVSGIDEFLSITGFEEVIKRADLLITGEGSLDEQTLHGKGPFGVAVRAKAHGLPVIGLAGKIPLNTNPVLDRYFDVVLAIGNEPADLAAALRSTADNLVRTATAVGNLLHMR